MFTSQLIMSEIDHIEYFGVVFNDYYLCIETLLTEIAFVWSLKDPYINGIGKIGDKGRAGFERWHWR